MKQQLQEQQNWLSTASLVVLAVVATAMTLHYTRDILVPFVVAIFIGSIFSPVMDVLELRWKFRHSLSVVIALLLIAFVGIICCLIVANAVQTIVDTSVTYGTKFEELGDSILERVDSLMSVGSSEQEGNLPDTSDTRAVDGGVDEIAGSGDTLAAATNVPVAEDSGGIQSADSIPNIEKESIEKNPPRKRAMREFLRSLAPRFASWTAASLINIFSGGTLTLIFVMFVMAGRSPHVVRKGVYREIDTQIRAYIGVKVALSLSTGLLVWLSLRVLSGVFEYDAGFGQLAFVFGLTAFLLNFIPSVGSVIATVIPLPFALAEVKTLFVADAFVGGGDIAWLLAVLIIPGSIQMLIGNVIEPKVLGDGLNLHPIAILLALAVWGLLWGPIGMLLAVPMTAIIRIVLMRFEITRPAGRLLAGELPGFDAEPATA